MTGKKFSEAELTDLRKNPYTASVNENIISFTVAFKVEFMRLYKLGIPVSEILPRLGYPIEVIGKARLNGISQKIRNEAKSPLGFQQGRSFKNVEELSVQEKEILTDRQLINRLQNEVAYLRQELEVIKKTRFVENTGKRKK